MSSQPKRYFHGGVTTISRLEASIAASMAAETSECPVMKALQMMNRQSSWRRSDHKAGGARA